MEMPQTGSNLEDEEVEEIDRLLMLEVEAILADKRIDEATGEITSAPLGPEYILPMTRRRRKSYYRDDDELRGRIPNAIRPQNRKDRIIVSNFMRGCRANPYPERGSVIDIKLSDSIELITMEGGQPKELIVEKHIRMDYDTGEWEHIKIFRDLNGIVVPVPMLQSESNDDD